MSCQISEMNHASIINRKTTAGSANTMAKSFPRLALRNPHVLAANSTPTAVEKKGEMTKPIPPCASGNANRKKRNKNQIPKPPTAPTHAATANVLVC